MSRNERVPTPMQKEKQETKCQEFATLDPKGLEFLARVAKNKTGKSNSSMREVCRPRLYEQVSAAAATHREVHGQYSWRLFLTARQPQCLAGVIFGIFWTLPRAAAHDGFDAKTSAFIACDRFVKPLKIYGIALPSDPGEDLVLTSHLGAGTKQFWRLVSRQEAEPRMATHESCSWSARRLMFRDFDLPHCCTIWVSWGPFGGPNRSK